MSNTIISKYKPLIDNRLNELIWASGSNYDSVLNAMKYSISIGGKRIRPCLLLEFARICGGDENDALNLGCALEMVHTYSLIHDDLPCMDNDDLRRGMPSCHKKFGEDIALLAGDGLLTLSFNIIAQCKNTSVENVIKCIDILSSYSGAHGMIGGQIIDLESENKEISIDVLKELCELKTARLLQAACQMGCIISEADETLQNAAYEYGYNLGMAFQIIDDILDVTSTTEELGKPVGSDNENNKSTFVSILGVDTAISLANEYTNKALTSLDPFGEDAELLKEFTLMLCKRKK